MAGFLVRKIIAEAKITNAEELAKKLIADAEKEAETLKKEQLLEAKEEVHRLRNEFEKEARERRNEQQRIERRLIQKEESLDRKLEAIEKKEELLNRRDEDIKRHQEYIHELYEKQKKELERLSGFTAEEAKEILFNDIRKEIEKEAAVMVKEIEAQAKDEAEKKAREIITYAIQKCAADHVTDTTVSVVQLPNDEMKGRIIGREGRNIRTLETLTGIDLIIDDTPEAVILSGFDPIRREIARIALEKLIADGRIHPARIEEMVEKARKEVDIKIREHGEQATFETGVHGVHPEMIKYLGRLNYRTSYGQNVLKHSIEVAQLAAAMAEELGADAKVARRAGLLHDIGKAVDHEMEGNHVQIGVSIARKYRESQEVIHAIWAHHNDIEPTTIEAVLVQAADAISAARPGARRETLEAYIKRLEQLEEIASSFNGVDKSYAIQAGRGNRVMVKPQDVSDTDKVVIAKKISKTIEEGIDFSGPIKKKGNRGKRAIG